MSNCTVLQIKQGNTPDITVSIIDGNGDKVEVSTITEAVFNAKSDIDDVSPAIELKLSLGEIEKDLTNNTLILKFSSADTNITPGEYLPYLKVEFSATSKQFELLPGDLLKSDGQPWLILEIVQKGIA